MNNKKVQEMYDKYLELDTLKTTAKFFNISPEGLRKIFIKNNIPYTKKKSYNYDKSFFDVDNEYSFYWAGFMAADGSISNKGDISLGLKLSDKTHIEKFASHIKTNAPIKITNPEYKTIVKIKTKTSGSAKIRFRAKEWCSSLKRFNVIPNKTKIFSIPENISENLMFKHFIRGYFDGDGWFAIRPSRISWGICGNYDTLCCIKNTLRKLCDLQGNPQIYKQNSIFKMEFNRQHDVMIISNFLYNDSSVFLNRKYEISKLSKIYDDNTIILNLNKNELQAELKQHKSYRLIAQKFGCSASSITNYVKKYKL